jgi:hypothetical protein
MLVDAVPPLMLIKTKANPDGLPIEAFDGSIRRDPCRRGDRRLAILERPHRRAPDNLSRVDRVAPVQVSQGNTTYEVSDELL